MFGKQSVHESMRKVYGLALWGLGMRFLGPSTLNPAP